MFEGQCEGMGGPAPLGEIAFWTAEDRAHDEASAHGVAASAIADHFEVVPATS